MSHPTLHCCLLISDSAIKLPFQVQQPWPEELHQGIGNALQRAASLISISQEAAKAMSEVCTSCALWMTVLLFTWNIKTGHCSRTGGLAHGTSCMVTSTLVGHVPKYKVTLWPQQAAHSHDCQCVCSHQVWLSIACLHSHMSPWHSS